MDRDVDAALGTLTPVFDWRADGTIHVRCREALQDGPPRLADRLTHWAATAPDRTFLAERDAAGRWRKVSYAAAEDGTRRIGSALLARGLTAERPIAILSGNGVEHGLLALAALRVGVPFAAVSPAYSLISGDFNNLRSVLRRLTPGLVFVAEAGPFARALEAACPADAEIVAVQGEAPGRPTTRFSEFADMAVSPAFDAAAAAVTPDSIAKFLFTSGSTGEPKGVIIPQRMLCKNQAMLSHWLPFSAETPPVLVDWLPWHHTFGGNHNYGYVLNNGGTLHIDHGKPTPEGIAETARNLREIAPTIYFNVPKGFEELARRMADDDALRLNFFSRLKVNFYAGAGLAPHVAAAMDELAERTIGRRVVMVTGLGATETGPSALAVTMETLGPGHLGLPLPEVEIKLVPNEGKLEVRAKGPAITPGYWRDPDRTAKAFDEEGYYCFGDALRFVDPEKPGRGFVFDGRISEDFKLSTGTWVSVGPLRARIVSGFAPLARDAVISGHDRNEVTALILPDPGACRAELGADGAALSDAEVLAHDLVRAAFARRLRRLQDGATGSSTLVRRIMLLEEPLSIDAGEITDKGSINQRAILARRAGLVEALNAVEPPAQVILAS